MNTSTTSTANPKTTTTHTDASPVAGAAEAAQPSQKPKKKVGRRKTKPATEDERVVSLSIPEPLLRRIRVLSAISGESISSMVVAALASKVRKELRQAMADLDT